MRHRAGHPGGAISQDIDAKFGPALVYRPNVVYYRPGRIPAGKPTG